ncbi:hypothetical protein BS47DRAFT_1369150 [Hydnum rufescens UP504]|uniref:Uncharacterized protein n=1 Tax=Hydnum rufescens UP504 TaxID=1448309 RepID=A0A9P6DMV6_9AGAM|nr:hypothetical protein BS47DRAFT_1369150 [Hydnum rufescens UP504]
MSKMARDRGENHPGDGKCCVLRTYSFGLEDIVLPLPYVQNSRYLDFQRLTQILAAVGFSIVKERHKQGGKLIYVLCRAEQLSVSGEQTHLGEETLPSELTAKRTLRTGDRNNFVILL